MRKRHEWDRSRQKRWLEATSVKHSLPRILNGAALFVDPQTGPPTRQQSQTYIANVKVWARGGVNNHEGRFLGSLLLFPVTVACAPFGEVCRRPASTSNPVTFTAHALSTLRLRSASVSRSKQPRPLFRVSPSHYCLLLIAAPPLTVNRLLRSFAVLSCPIRIRRPSHVFEYRFRQVARNSRKVAVARLKAPSYPAKVSRP